MHKREEMSETKICKTCNIEKEISKFCMRCSEYLKRIDHLINPGTH